MTDLHVKRQQCIREIRLDSGSCLLYSDTVRRRSTIESSKRIARDGFFIFANASLRSERGRNELLMLGLKGEYSLFSPDSPPLKPSHVGDEMTTEDSVILRERCTQSRGQPGRQSRKRALSRGNHFEKLYYGGIQ